MYLVVGRCLTTAETLESETKPRKIQRYLVISVAEADYVDDKGRKRPEKVSLKPRFHNKGI